MVFISSTDCVRMIKRFEAEMIFLFELKVTNLVVGLYDQSYVPGIVLIHDYYFL